MPGGPTPGSRDPYDKELRAIKKARQKARRKIGLGKGEDDEKVQATLDREY